MQVLDAMLRKGVELDERLLDTIVAELVKGGRWEEGTCVRARLGQPWLDAWNRRRSFHSTP